MCPTVLVPLTFNAPDAKLQDMYCPTVWVGAAVSWTTNLMLAAYIPRNGDSSIIFLTFRDLAFQQMYKGNGSSCRIQNIIIGCLPLGLLAVGQARCTCSCIWQVQIFSPLTSCNMVLIYLNLSAAPAEAMLCFPSASTVARPLSCFGGLLRYAAELRFLFITSTTGAGFQSGVQVSSVLFSSLIVCPLKAVARGRGWVALGR